VSVVEEGAPYVARSVIVCVFTSKARTVDVCTEILDLQEGR
jgi:hypothetical protein